jgi:hypothetical protein
MRVGDIRQAVAGHVRALHPDPTTTRIRYELGVCLGQTRVDIAVINGLIVGWEIKSAQDRLTRLPRQVELYNRVLDEATIVAAGRHASHVSEHVPDWWGIAEAEPGRGASACVIATVRTARANPDIDPFAVAQLLWRDEAYTLLRERNLHVGLARATRWTLWDRLASSLALTDLQSEVRLRIRARQDWPNDA